MPLTASTAPRVTLLMTVRERHALSESAIDSVLANTAMPCRFIYAAVAPPPALRARLEARAAAGQFEWVSYDEPLWPTEVRARLLPQIRSEYVVFLDNDVAVQRGWLRALVHCADETRAGIVAPLYLVGDSAEADTIHMAGGQLVAESTASGRALLEHHRLLDQPLAQALPRLRRERCDFAEFHCMLMRTEVARLPGLFDPAIVCVHEHVHAALTAREHGYETWFEPAARVTYRHLAPYQLGDLALFRKRWSPQHSESSLQAFARRWDVTDDHRSFDGTRGFVTGHTLQVDPLARPGDAAAMPTPGDLCRTRGDLLGLATRRGYPPEAQPQIEGAFALAAAVSEGMYRPCGRPFLEHLAGTAGVLLFHGFHMHAVLAGLLHSAYTHVSRRAHTPEVQADAIAQALQGAPTVERRVRAYAQRHARWNALAGVRADALSILDGEILAIAAANEVDLRLGGELAATGRPGELGGSIEALAIDACGLLGVPGLGASLRGPLPQGTPRPATGWREAFQRVGGQAQSITKWDAATLPSAWA